MNQLAPIVLFAFIRKDTLQLVVESLQNNILASESELHIFIDGPRNEYDKILVNEVTEYCHSIGGFKKVTIKRQTVNKGLDPSVIDGVSEIINQYKKVIVLEDDVITAPNFLQYMNQCLTEFEHDSRIMSISGWGIDLKIPEEYPYDAYLFGRSSSWGWATWKDRWQSVDWQITDWESFRKDRKRINQFNQRGGSDMFRMLKDCMNGGGMWDIRFCYAMFVQNKFSVIPIMSKTDNVGFTDLATHCKPVKFKRFTATLDSTYTSQFKIDKRMMPEMSIIKQRLHISSLKVRILTKIRNIIGL